MAYISVGNDALMVLVQMGGAARETKTSCTAFIQFVVNMTLFYVLFFFGKQSKKYHLPNNTSRPSVGSRASFLEVHKIGFAP